MHSNKSTTNCHEEVKETASVHAEGHIFLTPQEAKTLELISEGKLNKEIAKELNISRKTVEKHITSLFIKLNVNNRVEAVMCLTSFKTGK